jgi:putative ABC transport system permease protein
VAQFESLGSNLLTVQARQTVSFARGGIRQSARTLKETDVEAIRSQATTIALVAPDYSANATVVYSGKTTNVAVTGVTQEYAIVRNWTVIDGRFITEEDQTNVATVIVVGQKVVSDLLTASGITNPIGEVLRINRQSYEIVGVLKAKGTSGIDNQDNVIFMPLRTAQTKLGGAGTQTVRSISLQVRSKDEMDLAQAQVAAILRSLHGIATGGTDDFQIQNQTDLMTTVTQTTGTFTALLGAIAAISLLVGGIGIMNIMLVSVAERTREIGLRKAVGAKRRDVLFQFLTEAIVLSVMGGLIGVAMGIGLAQLITPLLGGTKTLVTNESIMLALSVSLGIGIFFGLYPANRAASLSPIDALRYE